MCSKKIFKKKRFSNKYDEEDLLFYLKQQLNSEMNTKKEIIKCMLDEISSDKTEIELELDCDRLNSHINAQTKTLKIYSKNFEIVSVIKQKLECELKHIRVADMALQNNGKIKCSKCNIGTSVFIQYDCCGVKCCKACVFLSLSYKCDCQNQALNCSLIDLKLSICKTAPIYQLCDLLNNHNIIDVFFKRNINSVGIFSDGVDYRRGGGDIEELVFGKLEEYPICVICYTCYKTSTDRLKLLPTIENDLDKYNAECKNLLEDIYNISEEISACKAKVDNFKEKLKQIYELKTSNIYCKLQQRISLLDRNIQILSNVELSSTIEEHREDDSPPRSCSTNSNPVLIFPNEKCSVCLVYDYSNMSKLNPCQHLICRKCLRSLVNDNCPLCRSTAESFEICIANKIVFFSISERTVTYC